MMIQSKIKAKGRVKAWLVRRSGVIIPVVDKFNTLNSDLFDNFKASWTTGANDFALDNLFVGGQETETGKDGIRLATELSTVSGYTMETTSVAATETWGAKWHGEFTLEDDENPEVISAYIGHDNQALTPFFDIVYAIASIPNVPMSLLDRFIVDWEIYT